jgi:hypothetical protein
MTRPFESRCPALVRPARLQTPLKRPAAVVNEADLLASLDAHDALLAQAVNDPASRIGGDLLRQRAECRERTGREGGLGGGWEESGERGERDEGPGPTDAGRAVDDDGRAEPCLFGRRRGLGLDVQPIDELNQATSEGSQPRRASNGRRQTYRRRVSRPSRPSGTPLSFQPAK